MGVWRSHNLDEMITRSQLFRDTRTCLGRLVSVVWFQRIRRFETHEGALLGVRVCL